MTSDAFSDSFVLRGTAAGGTLRFVGIDATRVVEDARVRHRLSKTATAALGRTLAASALLAVVLAGACLGFLPHNFNPARIFMGDSGSMLIGLMLAAATTSATPSPTMIPLIGTREIRTNPVTTVPTMAPAVPIPES